MKVKHGLLWFDDLTSDYPTWGLIHGGVAAACRGGGAAGLLAPWAARLGQLDCIILTFQLASPHLVDFHRGGAEPTNLA